MAQMRTSHPDESQLMFMAFDLLHQDGVDLRGLPLVERKLDLRRLCVKARCPSCAGSRHFPMERSCLTIATNSGSRGVVPKRLASRYSSGPSRNWVKTKCPGWKRINSERWRIFERLTKPELTETQKTLARRRAELARVIERLRSSPLSHGIARELRKQQSILEGEMSSWKSEPRPLS